MMGLQVMYVLLLLSTKAFGKGKSSRLLQELQHGLVGPNHDSAKLPRSPDLPNLGQEEAGGASPCRGIIEGTKDLKRGSEESLKASGSTGDLLSLLPGPGDVPRWSGGFPGVPTILRVGFNGYPGRLPGAIGGFGGGPIGFGSGPSGFYSGSSGFYSGLSGFYSRPSGYGGGFSVGGAGRFGY